MRVFLKKSDRTSYEKSKVQAGETSFELHTLGWKSFQDLCSSIIGSVWEQTVQSFSPTNDAGRDGAFRGSCASGFMAEDERVTGNFVVQCKFSTSSEKHLSLSDVREELPKAERLAQAGLADVYILMTNCALSARADAKIRASFENIKGIKRCLICGKETITRLIRENQKLRMLVPRVYGLGDLSQILDERAYRQAQEILLTLRDELAKFVITSAYRKSARALSGHGFVLLLGEPASGKSTIASTLALASADRWNCQVIKIRDAAHFMERWNPDEPAQFFWVDDALGQTQYERDQALAWNRAFPHLEAALKRGARVVFTSRDYIYREAIQDLKESAFPLLREAQVVVQVEKLTRREREQILYNHLKLGKQPSGFRAAIKPFLSSVATNPRFLPEIARRLGDPLFTKRLTLNEQSVLNFVQEPQAWLREVIKNLDQPNRAALSLVFMNGGRLRSPLELRAEEQKALQLLNATMGAVIRSLQAQDGTLVIVFYEKQKQWWGFKHPTIRDALGSLIVRERELMDIYLAGAPIESLLEEIVCATVELKGAKVIVPVDRYSLLIDRLRTAKRDGWDDRRSLYQFLERRCDAEFLRRYLAAFPRFLANLKARSWASYNLDCRVLARLFELDLLPEFKRLEFVATASRLARTMPDAAFLSLPKLVAMFRPDELRQARKEVKNGLLPTLKSVVQDWTDRYEPDEEDDPEDHFWYLRAALQAYEREFRHNQRASGRLNRAILSIDRKIEDLRKRIVKKTDGEIVTQSDNDDDQSNNERSVFEDVDA